MSIAILYLLYFQVSARLVRSHRQVSDLVRAIARTEYLKQRGERLGRASITIVIPAYNEEGTILQVLQRIPERLGGYATHPVVIEDGGTDRTSDVARGINVPVLGAPDQPRPGRGAAHRLRHRPRRRPDIVVTMDADGQHRPEEGERLIAPSAGARRTSSSARGSSASTRTAAASATWGSSSSRRSRAC